jgi:hypothetical protein
MPARLKEKLKELIDRPTGLLAFVGFGSLTCISLALPDPTVKTLADFLRQFDNAADALRYFEPKIAPFVLICVTIFWYYRYKGAVITELGLVDTIFEENHAPISLEKLDWHRFIPFIGYLLVATYCALILLAPYISFYCAGALVLNVTDLTGSALSLQNLNKTLARFPVVGQDPKIDFIKRRREVLKQYYFDNPTLPRIAVIQIVTVCTLLISLYIAPGQPIFELVSYAIMIANILGGELVIGVWRAKRDRKLKEIWDEEEDYSVGKP